MNRQVWQKIWSHSWLGKNLSFFLFLTFLGVSYISIGHFHDKLVRTIADKEKNLKEMDYEFKTIKSNVIFRSKSTELEKAVYRNGLKPLEQPPYRLINENIKK